MLKDQLKTVSAFAPATVSNVMVGFDLLGFPLEAPGDVVTLTRQTHGRIRITDIVSAERLPQDIKSNTASFALQTLCQYLNLSTGFDLHLQKGIPISSGMGGSAASAIATLVAFNQFLKNPLPNETLMTFALKSEALVSGAEHGDNAIPCLYGGLTLIHQLKPLRIISLPILPIACVLIHPHLSITTAEARALLPKNVPQPVVTQQSAHLAAFITALFTKDLTLLKNSLVDVWIEPLRAPLIPAFSAVKQAALEHGALGCSLSGSGPSLFALATSAAEAQVIAKAMQGVFQAEGIASDVWISKIMPTGARILFEG